MKAMSPGGRLLIFMLSVMLHALPLAGLWHWAHSARELPPEPEALSVEMIRLAPPDPPSERPPGPVQTEASAQKVPPRHAPRHVVDSSVEALQVPRIEQTTPIETPSDAPPAPATTAPVSRPAPPAPRAVSTPPDWRAQLLTHIEKYKRYPAEARLRRHEGVVTVGFRVDPRGKVVTRRLVRGSGVPALDAEALRVLRAASPLPVPADTALQGQEIVVELEFFIQ
ncbi:MAG: energy transducer TonB [Asticcacaulis sp.]